MMHPRIVYAAVDDDHKRIPQVERGVEGGQRPGEKPAPVIEIDEVARGQIVIGFDVGEIVVTCSRVIIGSPYRVIVVIIIVIIISRSTVVGCSTLDEAERQSERCENDGQFLGNFFHLIRFLNGLSGF